MGVTQFFGDTSVGWPLLASATVIVCVGIWDDLRDLSILKKLPFQVLAIVAVLLWSPLKLETLHGFLYVDQISPWLSYPLSALLVLFFMQAYNLIDGIDGHAASIGIVIFGCFGTLFWMMQDFLFLTISAVLVAGLVVYLWYNFSNIYKIFMGDTGTLLIGFFIGFSLLRIFSYSPGTIEQLPFDGRFLPVLLSAVLFVPTFDVIRVMIVRRRERKPVLSPDRNHVHHVLTDAGLSHRRASFLSASFSLSFILIVFLIIQSQSIVLLSFAAVLFILLVNLILLRLNGSFRARRMKVAMRKPVQKYSRLFKALGLYNFFV
jgi:UDP-N-acetylmuramyl pentapeptide phosphotransferase/UDP-N-acetylglucosamine-1-phosphate transferase